MKTKHVIEGGLRTNMIASGDVPCTPFANLLGIFVASTTSGTVKVNDSQGNIANTFTPAAATFYPLPCCVQGKLTVTISGTVDLTVFWVPH